MEKADIVDTSESFLSALEETPVTHFSATYSASVIFDVFPFNAFQHARTHPSNVIFRDRRELHECLRAIFHTLVSKTRGRRYAYSRTVDILGRNSRKKERRLTKQHIRENHCSLRLLSFQSSIWRAIITFLFSFYFFIYSSFFFNIYISFQTILSSDSRRK